MVDVTLIYAGVMALLSVLLANYVLYIRLRTKTVPKWQPNAAERVQANFVENVPLALVLLVLSELAGAPTVFLHGCGISLVVLRILHAWGLATNEGANYPRLIGAQGTFVLMSILGMSAIYLSIAP
ncbi:MAG: MAPEG family protein [Pseudomonadota bacterium]